ncbi:mechanosensitive ion channel family protein [Achromobacter mucicolens]|uniref:mechanosensitive ion channel family protein n=1 Tax=Achromobacter mucicolens TaxID=1389922 RepID=UPI0024473377|nr:mechanosensitive ion channel domain-containing protein [Achromobacter mucicolens]MDH0092414.1 mechanosensitive ion channel family protein [Achromobacter mucicolens]
MPLEWEELVTQLDVHMPREIWAQTLIGIGALVLTALFVQWVVARVVLLLAHRLLVVSGHGDWDKALQRRRAYQNLWYAVPFAVVSMGIDLVPHAERVVTVVGRLAHAGAWICVFIAFSGVLSAWQDTYSATTRAQTRSIKGYIQIGKLVLMAVCTVLVLSILIDRSPLWMISGLGALSAVLLLVFKDTLLSLVASTQLTSNDMLRIGDWIEMPQCNADGFVKDIALHTVKVQNWDNTVTTVPTYKLFSESYRNYRHMFESGGRRIKRTVRIDAASVRFLTDDEAQRLMKFRLLHDYLQSKTQDIVQANQTLGELASVPANRRRLTNIGTLRAYALAYLKQNSEIRQDMAMMVRMMEPTSEGIPVEVYCFTAVTAWVEYERIQGDVFDHLLAILPELGLRLYQQPSGADIGAMGGYLRDSAIQAALAAERDRQGPVDGAPALPFERGLTEGKMPRQAE